MPAKDTFHDEFRNALVKDGWTVTHDPFTLTFGGEDVFVDLGAERMIAAEKGLSKIAVEIKSFVGISAIHELEGAVGQFAFYRSLLKRVDPDRKLYLAVPLGIFVTTMQAATARPV
jgi:XisH protein